MRWSYIIPRITLLLLVWAFFFFAFDPLLKWGAIKGIEKVAKAKVEIAGIKTSFLHPSLKITGFAVADSGDEFRNLAEFSELAFSAAGAPLLEKKLLVENASLTGLRFATPRKTSGKLRFIKQPPPSPLIQELKQESKDFSLERTADIKTEAVSEYTLNADDLESVKLAKQLELTYEKDYKNISDRLDIKKYEQAIEALKTRYQASKGEGNFIKQAKEYSEIGKEVNRLSKQFKQDKQEIEAAARELKDSFKALDAARKKDIASVMAKMKLPSMDTQSLARMLAGPLIAEKTAQAMVWVTTAKKYMPANSKGVMKNEAPRGRVVHFPKEKSLPAILVRKLFLSGELGLDDPLEYSGEILNLTTQPRLYGRPATALIKGAKGERRFKLTSSIDASGDYIKTDSRLTYTGIPLQQLQLGSASSFQVDITGATGAFTGALKTTGDALDGRAEMLFTGASFKPNSEKIKAALLRSAVESAFNKLSSARIESEIAGTIKNPRLSIKTDLADALSKAFSGALGAEAKKAQAEAQEKIDAALKPYREKLDNLAASKKSELDDKLKGAESKVSGEGEKLLKDLTPAKLKLPKLKF